MTVPGARPSACLASDNRHEKWQQSHWEASACECDGRSRWELADGLREAEFREKWEFK